MLNYLVIEMLFVYTAQNIPSLCQKIIFVSIIFISIFSLSLNIEAFVLIFINFTNLLYLYLILFKLLLFIVGIKVNKDLKHTIKEHKDINFKHIDTHDTHNINTFYQNKCLKLNKNITCKDYNEKILNVSSKVFKYSILIPLYKEHKVVSQLIHSISFIDFNKKMLEVFLILEEDDFLTVNAVNVMELPAYFTVIQVPLSNIRTKGGACNYALKFVNSDFVTIFDAEDRPSPDQLMNVINMFINSEDNFACIQARLTYYNANENLITKMFAIEYSALFDYTLHALSWHDMPIPLGGTSNHFKTNILKKLGGWDKYNVTEDAAIGMAIAINNYKIGMIQNYTYEEATITFKAWLQQRARWMKGHIQTYLSVMRSPLSTYKKLGRNRFLCFNYMLGVAPVAMLLLPFCLLISILINTNVITISSRIGDFTRYFSLFNLIFGMTTLLFNSLIVKIHRKDIKIKYSFLIFPLYFCMHIIAAYIAIWELIVKPYHWNKTEHGISNIK